MQPRGHRALAHLRRMPQHTRRGGQHPAAFGRSQTSTVQAVRRALAQVSRHVACIQQSTAIAYEHHQFGHELDV